MHMCNIAELQERRYTRDMSAALGIYLKTLREGQGLRPSEVLAKLSARLGRRVDESRLWRAEKGVAWPDGDFLTALLDILGARLADVAWIQRNPDAADEAKLLAQSWLKQEQEVQIQRFQGKLQRVVKLGEHDPERLEQVIERLRSDVRADPELLDLIMAYLDGRRSLQG